MDPWECFKGLQWQYDTFFRRYHWSHSLSKKLLLFVLSSNKSALSMSWNTSLNNLSASFVRQTLSHDAIMEQSNAICDVVVHWKALLYKSFLISLFGTFFVFLATCHTTQAPQIHDTAVLLSLSILLTADGTHRRLSYWYIFWQRLWCMCLGKATRLDLDVIPWILLLMCTW
jgi:hypothetical protein